MFTGIITAVGTLRAIDAVDGGRELLIAVPWTDIEPGESIAVDGACLTVTGLEPGAFRVHVITTSMERTRIGEYQVGTRVNLERAVRAGDRLGGHIVQGHVDGVGTVEAVRQSADARLLDIRAPQHVAAALIPLGSIAVDGVSLTVNALPAPEIVQVSLIPFTLEQTTLGERRPGDRVHLEGDPVGKYVRQFMQVTPPVTGAS
jgi:riboflavin synthase